MPERHSGVNPPDQWSGEAKVPGKRDEYLDDVDLRDRVFVVGRLVETADGWFLENVERQQVAHEEVA